MKISQYIPPWSLKCILLVLVYTVRKSNAVVTNGGSIKELQDCYNNYARTNLRDVVGQPLSWHCEAHVIMELRTAGKKPNQPASSVAYVDRICDKFMAKRAHSRVRRQASGHPGGGPQDPGLPPKCRRKEYRTLDDEERHRFHRALNALKQDRTVEPSKYDALAFLHTGITTNAAHGGPKFLSWHRVYLLLMEIALQEIDPRICIPFWDSSLDSELDDSSTSYVFSPEFLGGGDGEVVDGPFAGWIIPEHGPLMRNLAGDGQLFTLDAIESILSRTRTHEIVPPNAEAQHDLEYYHGGVHVYMGGQMMELETAAYDPAFFLHHCFVDYLWEMFRTKQRAMRIDPAQDYPEDFGSPLHAQNSPLGLNLNLTAHEGYEDYMMDSYEYVPSPDCNRRRPNCGSKYLRCNVRRGRCVPINPNEPGPNPNPGTTPGPGPTPGPDPVPKPKKCKKQIRPTQNNYCIDGVCDTSKWVYVPVKVVSVRPPGFGGYGSYPVKNGRVSKTSDIYQPSAYAETTRYISNFRGTPKSYDHCDDGDGIGQVYVQSTGINYAGFYKESAVIDQRLATSISIAYVAVKDPKHGPVKSLFRAFDSCGRICHTACKIPGTDQYEPCSGVLNIEDIPGQPRQYSRTYGQAALNTWGYAANEDCPSFITDNITLTFYCDYRDRLPWADQKTSQRRTKPKPVVQAKPEPPPTNPNECKVDDECTIGVPCKGGKNKCSSYGETHKCRGSCNKYAVCNYGQYWTRSCPFNWSFNENWHSCTKSRRCAVTERKPVRKPNRRVIQPPVRSSYLHNLRGRFYGSRRRFFG